MSLPDDEVAIEALFTAERSFEEAPGDEVRRRVRRAVHARVGVLGGSLVHAADPSPGASQPHLGAAPPTSVATMALPHAVLGMIGAFVVGGAIGAAVMRSTLPTVVDRHAPIVAASIAPIAALPSASSLPEAAPILELSDSAPAAVRPAPSTSGDGRAVAAERAVLDSARIALANGEPAQAMAFVERHEKAFPRGGLIEEREALAIRALAKQKRTGEAHARGARFRSTWPRSLAMPAVDAALDSLDGGSR